MIALIRNKTHVILSGATIHLLKRTATPQLVDNYCNSYPLPNLTRLFYDNFTYLIHLAGLVSDIKVYTHMKHAMLDEV